MGLNGHGMIQIQYEPFVNHQLGLLRSGPRKIFRFQRLRQPASLKAPIRVE